MSYKFSYMVPLIIFTALMTIASGIIIGITITHFETTFILNNLLVGDFILAFCGLVVSFMHITQKPKSLLAPLGLIHSWLSREILFSGIFVAMLLICILKFFELLNYPATLNSLFILTSIISIGTTLTIGMVYNLESQLAWKGFVNIITPLCSSLLLGFAIYELFLGSEIFLVLLIIDNILFIARRKKIEKKSTEDNRIFLQAAKTLKPLQIIRISLSILLVVLFVFELFEILPYLVAINIVLDRIIFYAATSQTLPQNTVENERQKRFE